MIEAGAQDSDLIVGLLAVAFDDNRSVNYVVAQDERRRERIRALMAYSFKVCSAFGEVWLSDDRRACALVLFPDKKRTTLSSIWWDIQMAFSVIGIARVGKVLGREAKIKAFHPKSQFAYLWFVGVHPDSQNQGKGSELLRNLIERYMNQDRPIYLETSVERNLPWYSKHGFEIFNTLQLTYPLSMLRRIPLRS